MNDAAPLPAHRIDLGAGWSLWRWVLVRAAGFPARGVLALAAPDAAALADELLQLEVEVASLRGLAIEELSELPTDRGVAAHRSIVQLQRGRMPSMITELEGQSVALRTLRERDAARTQKLAEFEQAFAAAAARTAEVVCAVGQDPRFREALLWQNRTALHTGVDWLLAHPTATHSAAQKKRHLIASYLQRYSVKNDTIGFFGPLGWGEVGTSAGVDVRPGPALLKKRQATLEHWAIDALAKAIAADGALRPFLAPRLGPSNSVIGTTLRYGFGKTSTLNPLIARLLTACDGETTAIEIARGLVADPTADIDSEDEVYEFLSDLAERKLVIWTLELSALVRPEIELRRLLERIEVPELRARALAPLDRLEAARDQVAAAAGDIELLGRALEELDVTFQEVSGQAATRRAGETYASRTPLYEECERDLTLTLGRPVVERLGPVLSLVAQSARWFTHEIASRFRAALHDLHRTLVAPSGEPVQYVRFLHELDGLFPLQERSPIAVAIEGELDRRWEAILDLDLSQRRVTIAAADIAERVMHTFAAPGPGWPGARHVSPDILIAARRAEDVTRGDFTIVLGEVHIGNTLLAHIMIEHGPDEEDSLIRAYERDLPDERLLGVLLRHKQNRAQNMSWSPRDFDLEIGTSRSWRPRSHVLRAADLVIEERGASLAVRDVRTGRAFDLIAVLEPYLVDMVLNEFKLGPRAPHVPRVTIDGVVLCREQWRFTAAEVPTFCTLERGAPQFAAARAWAQARGIPRWVFAKIPEEKKPTYVDLASPIYVEMFARMLRKASSLTVSEMLPSIEDTWIPDAAGQTYTSELRMVMVDPVPWTNPWDVPARTGAPA